MKSCREVNQCLNLDAHIRPLHVLQQRSLPEPDVNRNFNNPTGKPIITDRILGVWLMPLVYPGSAEASKCRWCFSPHGAVICAWEQIQRHICKCGLVIHESPKREWVIGRGYPLLPACWSFLHFLLVSSSLLVKLHSFLFLPLFITLPFIVTLLPLFISFIADRSF